jgi:hypothetical protein
LLFNCGMPLTISTIVLFRELLLSMIPCIYPCSLTPSTVKQQVLCPSLDANNPSRDFILGKEINYVLCSDAPTDHFTPLENACAHPAVALNLPRIERNRSG